MAPGLKSKQILYFHTDATPDIYFSPLRALNTFHLGYTSQVEINNNSNNNIKKNKQVTVLRTQN